MKSTVNVILATYNGEKFIKAQIDSILKQVDVCVELYIYDDESTDNTAFIINQFNDTRIHFSINEKNLGPKLNYLNALKKIPSSEYYAFSDQDDVWEKDKLSMAIKKIGHEDNICKLYFSRAKIVDANLNLVGLDGFKKKQIKFPEILTRNNGIGCTFVFNNKLRDYAKKIDLNEITSVQLHDQWVYAICVLLDGEVFLDDNSYILYRQHTDNVVGGKKRGVLEKVKSSAFFKKNRNLRFAQDIYNFFNPLLSSKNKKSLEIVSNYKNNYSNRLSTIRMFLKSDDSFFHKLEIIMLVITGKF